MVGEGCGLATTETHSSWVCTGNDSSPENSARLVRVCDVSGTILGYRVTPMPILAIRMFKPDNLREDEAKILIVTHLSIFIYDAGLENCLSIIDTEPNPNGAIAITHQEPLRIAYPCPSTRSVNVATINGECIPVFPNTFSANLQILEFSPSGTKLGATDQDGLTVYTTTLPDTQVPSQHPLTIKSYRRGTMKCKMTSISFNPRDEDVLCCASDHGTIHVFNINPSASVFSRSGTVMWNFQIKENGKHSATTPATCWCHFSSDGSRLYRVSDSRVHVYNVDCATQAHTLLIVKDFIARK